MATDVRTRAQDLRAQGLSWRRIADELGVSPTSARRFVDPGFEERQRVMSRDAKRVRTGVCEECGGETRYNGLPGAAVGQRCGDCARRAVVKINQAKRGTGPLGRRILAYLAEPHRFMEIRDELGTTDEVLGALLDRLMRYGLIRRVSRGVYVRAGGTGG